MKIISSYNSKSANKKYSSLKPLVKEIQYKKIAAFDLETDGLGGKLVIGGFYDGENYYEFFTEKQFLKLITKQKYKSYYIYAHNGGKYDFLYLLEHLQHKVEMIDINGRILSLKIQINKGQYVYLVDSYYTLEYSLEKLIKAFKIKHKKIKIDFNNVKKDDPKVKEHLKNDCFALYEIMIHFQDLINSLGGSMKMTSASTSLDLFRRNYLDRELPTYFKQEPIIRESYFGGRTEVIKKHLKNGFYYDINSLYPAMMYKNYFPVGKPTFIGDYNYSKNDIGFVEITTKINQYLPILPFRQNGMLLFPNGIIKGWYAIPYLNELKKLNIPFKVNRAILFDKAKIFRNFVSDLYKLRLENKKTVLELVIKLMMNSLYGKFATQIEKKIFVINPEIEQLTKLKLYSIPFEIFYFEKQLKYNYILPALSSYVTSYGQLELYKYLDENTYYCDTDSIVTTKKLNTGIKLGEMKLENEIIDGYFLTQKMYCFKNQDNKIIKKAKGFNKEMIKNISHNHFKKAIYENDYLPFLVVKNSMFGWKESIIRKKETLVNNGQKKKSIKNVDTKRIFLDINKSIPIKIN